MEIWKRSNSPRLPTDPEVSFSQWKIQKTNNRPSLTTKYEDGFSQLEIGREISALDSTQNPKIDESVENLEEKQSLPSDGITIRHDACNIGATRHAASKLSKVHTP